MAEQPYLTKTYYLLALEPMHVGAGGMQLGRVDNAIVREAGTKLPKIPATSLAGVTRNYTAMHHPDRYQRPVKDEEGNVVYQSCARSEPDGRELCGQRDCPVCISYGFARPDGRSFPSMSEFGDARILFFPVSSMIGPVWVTSPTALHDLVEARILPPEGVNSQVEGNSYRVQTALKAVRLNLGWLLLDIAHRSAPLTETGITLLKEASVPKEILNRLVLVPDPLFSHVVNNNLEVRTSTAINALTGASLEGALFTYEAIPRATLFWFQVIYKRPSDFLLDGKPVECDMDWVRERVEEGLDYFEYLGVGGMVNRGMGRLRVLNL